MANVEASGSVRLDAQGRWRDARGRFAAAPPPPPHQPPVERYRLTVFGQPRGAWRDSYAAAMNDAITAELASWDAWRREHYLAVPVSIERRRE